MLNLLFIFCSSSTAHQLQTYTVRQFTFIDCGHFRIKNSPLHECQWLVGGGVIYMYVYSNVEKWTVVKKTGYCKYNAIWLTRLICQFFTDERDSRFKIKYINEWRWMNDVSLYKIWTLAQYTFYDSEEEQSIISVPTLQLTFLYSKWFARRCSCPSQYYSFRNTQNTFTLK